MTSEQWFSKANIIAIVCAVASIAVSIIDKYWGLGGLGVGLIVLGLAVVIVFSRKTPYFPFLLLLIGFALGQVIQLNFSQAPAWIADNGVAIPAGQWKFSGLNIDDKQETTPDHIRALVSLKSTQGENSFTSPLEKITFTLYAPGVEYGIKQNPLQGIKTTIHAQPENSSFADELIYCNYTLLYNGKTYTSNTYFVPIDQPTTLVWDFSSRADVNYDDLPEETKTSLESAQRTIFQDDGGFVSLMRRQSESWNYQYLVLKNYKPASIENVALTCGVSATREFRQGKAGDVFEFQGYITFGNTVLYPVDARIEP